MVMAEISITPVGTGRTGVSFYVARAIEAVSQIPNLKYEINDMGTVIESDRLETILDAIRIMTITVHNLGVGRVGVVVKIDSRLDRHSYLGGKVSAVRRHLDDWG